MVNCWIMYSETTHCTRILFTSKACLKRLCLSMINKSVGCRSMSAFQKNFYDPIYEHVGAYVINTAQNKYLKRNTVGHFLSRDVDCTHIIFNDFVWSYYVFRINIFVNFMIFHSQEHCGGKSSYHISILMWWLIMVFLSNAQSDCEKYHPSSMCSLSCCFSYLRKFVIMTPFIAKLCLYWYLRNFLRPGWTWFRRIIITHCIKVLKYVIDWGIQ